MAQSYTREALRERAGALVPRLAERAQATSAARQVPAETIKDSGTPSSAISSKPKKFGGPELRVDEAFEIASVLSRGDGSAAWVWTVMGSTTCSWPISTRRRRRNIGSMTATLSASSFAPGGKLTPGRWRLKAVGQMVVLQRHRPCALDAAGQHCGHDQPKNPPIPISASPCCPSPT